MRRLQQPRAILFDWDNTLIDSWHLLHAALTETFLRMGHTPWTFEETKLRVRASLRDSFPGLFKDRWEEAQNIFYDYFAAHHLGKLRAMPDAEIMLRGLLEEGIYLGVVSNKKGSLLRAEVDHLRWTPHFGRIVGAGDASRDKPAPDPVWLALEPSVPSPKFLSPGEVWFVGDADIDMACGVGAGCVAILLREEAPRAQEFVADPPEEHFPNCRSLLNFVRDLG